jgi:hypothetical protein
VARSSSFEEFCGVRDARGNAGNRQTAGRLCKSYIPLGNEFPETILLDVMSRWKSVLPLPHPSQSAAGFRE